MKPADVRLEAAKKFVIQHHIRIAKPKYVR